MVAPREPSDSPGRSAGRQPASAADLSQYPPATPACAPVRNLLRDFVDGDLRGDEINAVEVHVHRCRSCALALSRAESERMQITSALGSIDAEELEPGAEFTATLMAEVEKLAKGRPPVGFTSRVMLRVRETVLAETARAGPARAGVARGDAGSRRWSLPVAAVAVTVLVAVSLAVWAALAALAALQPPSSVFEVVSAVEAKRHRHGAVAPLGQGDVLRSGDRVTTADGGSVEARWRTPSGVAALWVGEGASLQLVEHGARIGLDAGAVDLTTPAELEVLLSDGSAVTVVPGRYALTVQPVRHQDARRGVRVDVEVSAGTATILRGPSRVEVFAGRLARYTTFTSVRVSRAPDAGLFAMSRRNAAGKTLGPDRIAPRSEPFFGQLLDPRTRLPVADATVQISTFRGTQTIDTDGRGRFRLTGIAERNGQFAVVRAVPPAGSEGLSAMVPAPVRLDRVPLSGGMAEPRRFFLRRGHSWRGRVVDADHRPVPGAWVQAFRVDDALGTAVPISGAVTVYRGGGFVVDGIPRHFAAHESFVLIAGGADRLPTVVLARTGVRVEDSALELVLPQRPTGLVLGLEPEAAVRLLLPVAGLPDAVVVRVVQSDADGRLRMPSDGCFVMPENGPLQRATIDGDRVRLVAAPRHEGAATRLREGKGLAPRRVHWLGPQTPYDLVVEIPSDGVPGAGGLISVFEESSRQACPNSQVFLRHRGRLQFLGVYEGREPLRCAKHTVGELLAVTADGWVGTRRLDRELGVSHVSLPVSRTGQLVATEAEMGLLWLWRETDAGLQPVLRERADGVFSLRPGTYRRTKKGPRFDVRPGASVDLPKK